MKPDLLSAFERRLAAGGCAGLPRRDTPLEVIDVGRLQRSNRRRDELLDRFRHIGAIGFAARQARHPLRVDERVIECAEQELGPPDDRRPRQLRQAFPDRLDKRAGGVVEDFGDDAAYHGVAFRRHHGAQPREPRPAPGQIAAGRKRRLHIGAHDRLQPVLNVAHAPRRHQQFDAPLVHGAAMTLVDFEQQPVLGLEVIGDAAGVGARFQRDVADRNGIEAAGREQQFGRAQDRFPHIGISRHRICFLFSRFVRLYKL